LQNTKVFRGILQNFGKIIPRNAQNLNFISSHFVFHKITKTHFVANLATEGAKESRGLGIRIDKEDQDFWLPRIWPI